MTLSDIQGASKYKQPLNSLVPCGTRAKKLVFRGEIESRGTCLQSDAPCTAAGDFVRRQFRCDGGLVVQLQAGASTLNIPSWAIESRVTHVYHPSKGCHTNAGEALTYVVPQGSLTHLWRVITCCTISMGSWV